MPESERLRLEDVECKVCEIASERLGLGRERVRPESRILQDLHCDSLELVELVMAIEQAFQITLPDRAPDPVYKAVFTRQPFCLADLAELVYLEQGTGAPERLDWTRERTEPPVPSCVPFTQLGGRYAGASRSDPLEPLEPAGTGGVQYRRRSDGMRCLLIPAATVEIGCDAVPAHPDEQPRHKVEIDAFLIDAEPVSTTAYCRFLNSAGETSSEILADWFVLDPDDSRSEHMLIKRDQAEWRPITGAERWPMILVSWFGANAYSLWANGKDWRPYRGESAVNPPSFLPSEAQWEYAARGAAHRTFPWGDEPPTDERMRYASHRKGATYTVETLPLADVNAKLGMSPFGLHHMAGNVWQWCQDWYDEAFYMRPDASRPNPVNQTPTKTRSERGGSWIGPADLCRGSFRRGRPPQARGRCLGFRCTNSMPRTGKRALAGPVRSLALRSIITC